MLGKALAEYFTNMYVFTVKSVNKDNPQETTIVVFVERWSLFRGQFLFKLAIWGFGNMVFVEGWSLFGGGLSSRFDCTSPIGLISSKLTSYFLISLTLCTRFRMRKPIFCNVNTRGPLKWYQAYWYNLY